METDDTSTILENLRTTEFVYEDSGLTASIFQTLLSFKEQGLFTDVNIHVEQKVFKCHRVVLAASCCYFNALFQHETDWHQSRDDDLYIPEITAAGFAEIYDFMYTSRIRITSENVTDVLETADFLQFRDIVEICCDILLQHVALENCLALEQLASSHLCLALAEGARQYAAAHFEDMAETEHFPLIAASSLKSLLTHSAFCISNVTNVLAKLCIWAEKVDDRRDSFTDILLCLKSKAKITREELVSLKASFSSLSEQIDAASRELTADSTGEIMVENLLVVPRNVSNTGKGYSNEIMAYDDRKETWRTLTHLPCDGMINFSVSVLNNILYICGGMKYHVGSDEVWTYDPGSGSAGWREGKPMLEARWGHSSASLHGRLYIVGGDAPGHAPRPDAEVYDSATLQWSVFPNLVGLHLIGCLTLVPLGEKLYALGSRHRNATQPDVLGKKSSAEVQCYDIRKRVWERCDRLSTCLVANGFSLGMGHCLPYKGHFAIIDEDPLGRKILLYNPVTKKVAPFVYSHGQHKFAGYQIWRDKLFCTGGVHNFRAHDRVRVRNLVSEKTFWRLTTSLPKRCSHHACVILQVPETEVEPSVIDVENESTRL